MATKPPTLPILAAILGAGEAFGLEVMALVKEQTCGELDLGWRCYPALRALERDGLLDSRESEPMPERGGRPRIYYRVTARGEEVLAQMQRDGVGHGPR